MRWERGEKRVKIEMRLLDKWCYQQREELQSQVNTKLKRNIPTTEKAKHAQAHKQRHTFKIPNWLFSSANCAACAYTSAALATSPCAISTCPSCSRASISAEASWTLRVKLKCCSKHARDVSSSPWRQAERPKFPT